tara:strand:+ start:2492 stop:2854 length:363 start_codon:yes stop_codon:yes gene_type:complete
MPLTMTPIGPVYFDGAAARESLLNVAQAEALHDIREARCRSAEEITRWIARYEQSAGLDCLSDEERRLFFNSLAARADVACADDAAREMGFQSIEELKSEGRAMLRGLSARCREREEESE